MRAVERIGSGLASQVGMVGPMATIAMGALLLDEPFSSLDASLTERMRLQMKAWFKQEHLTVILVTHDPQDAAALADITLNLSPKTPFKLTEN